MAARRYPFWKALISDFPCQCCTIFQPLLWGVFLWDPVKILLGWKKKVTPIDREKMWDFVPVLAGVSIVLLAVGLIRARYLQKKLSEAEEVTATVSGFGMRNVRGWSMVNFTYEFGGAIHEGALSVPEFQASALEVGSKLAILVPPSSPSKAYLKVTYD